MAHILTFRVDGLAGRSKPYAAKLNRDVNVFFGLNGSGKTTLLKLLYSALSNNTAILKDVPFERAEVTFLSNKYKVPVTRSIEQKDLSPDANLSSGVHWVAGGPYKAIDTLSGNRVVIHDEDAVWTIDPRRPNWKSSHPEPEGSPLSISTAFLPISRLYRNLPTQSGAKRLSDQELDSAFARGLQAQWSEYYADISREISKVQERGFANILDFFLSGQTTQTETIDTPDPEDAYKRVSGFLHRQRGFDHLLKSKRDFLEGYAKRPELRNVVQQIESVEKQIADIIAPRNKFRSVLEAMFTGSKSLTFTEKEIQVQLSDKRPIGLSLLSSGEKQLLYIALYALIGGYQPLIVDEPELSMHVDWQKKLISTLSDLNPQIQQIMATHSPEIMADLQDNRVFRL